MSKPNDDQPTAGSCEASFSSDQPIQAREQDQFNRWPFAQRVAQTLAARQDSSSLVIAIYGAWGDGKTSTLRLMEQALQEEKNVICLSFNPWLFGSTEQLLRGFFATLAEALDKSITTASERLGEALQRYGSLLSLASLSFGGLQVSPGDAAQALGDALSTVELDELRGRVERILSVEKKRVVVMVDDIDRLDRGEIQAIFKLVKLSASFRYTSYVLAFDDEVVAASLGEKYGSGGLEAGRSFLEKIVQVPLHLPPADEISLRSLTFDGVNTALLASGIDLSQDDANAFVRRFIDGLQPRLKTPRQAKLYLNSLMFALPLLKGEVHPVDHMLIEGIRVFYPKLYATIRDNPEYFLQSQGYGSRHEALKQRTDGLIQSSLEGLGLVDPNQIRRDLVGALFPRVSNMSYGPEWEKIWAEEQRVCSTKYFSRYFHYGIRGEDISDVVVAGFLSSLGSTEADVDSELCQIARKGSIARLIQKLRTQEDLIDAGACARLAGAIARNASLLPREKGMVIPDFTYRQAGILVAHLVRKSSSILSERAALARHIMGEAEPLSFAFECLRWLRKGNEQEESERILCPEVEREIGGVLAGRVREAALLEPPYKSHPDDAPWLLWVWNEYGRPGEVEAFFRVRFEQDCAEVEEFIAMYVPTAWGMESGIPHKSDFDRNAYDWVARLIDPGFVLQKLRERYGAELDDPKFYHERGVLFPPSGCTSVRLCAPTSAGQ
jgi:KAP family P-loop domain